ncbi:MAG: hypothetical protein JRE70_15520, partial [Deltaproteobacteria bacterium]|nr:hypothetical protein [Deltaproteobacteria bacterium]
MLDETESSGSSSRTRHGSSFLLVILTFIVEPAEAGPPLISDDPHTVGPGRVEVILAASGFGYGELVALQVPAADLTLGVFEGLDVSAVISPVFTFAPDLATESSAALSLGLKWQPLRGQHWNAAFTPTGAINFPLLGETTLILPAQIEYTWQRLSLGVDGGYVVDFDDEDLWFAILYGGWTATDTLSLLAEIWGGESTRDHAREVGLTFGLDWMTPMGMHWLAAAGPGIASSGGRRVRWRFYLGLQWNFALWSRDSAQRPGSA